MMHAVYLPLLYLVGWLAGPWAWTKVKGLFWQGEGLAEKKIKGE